MKSLQKRILVSMKYDNNQDYYYSLVMRDEQRKFQRLHQ